MPILRAISVLFLSCLLFAPGCCFPAIRASLLGPDHTHKTLLIDLNTIGPSEYTGIVFAAHEWEDRTGLVAFDIVLYQGTIPKVIDPVIITNVRTDDPIVLSEEDYLHKQGKVNVERVLGLYTRGAQPAPTIYLVAQRLQSNAAYFSVCMHEMGHILGLHHIDKPGALMYESFDFNEHHITVDDIVELCRIKYCDPIVISQRF